MVCLFQSGSSNVDKFHDFHETLSENARYFLKTQNIYLFIVKLHILYIVKLHIVNFIKLKNMWNSRRIYDEFFMEILTWHIYSRIVVQSVVKYARKYDAHYL